MYEAYTADTIHTTILGNIDDDYEKSVGYPTYDFTRSYAIEELALYQGIDAGINKMYIKNLSGDELTLRVSEWRGITRKTANASVGIVTVLGNGIVNIGDIFSTVNGIQFTSLVAVTVTTTADINVIAVIAGANGNVGANSIVQMPVTLQGIVSCTNSASTYDGYDEETDVSLRQRYYDSLQIPPTSGNQYHYLAWAKDIVGVGDAKCFPLWNGDNTVKIVIIDANEQPANADVISRVQTYIDPLDASGNPQGTGEGQAPIGAYCTVVSATPKAINITVTITPETGYTTAELQTSITTSITTYLAGIAFQQDYVSYAKLGDTIINTTGVKDYSNLQINSTSANIDIADTEVAILGTVVIS